MKEKKVSPWKKYQPSNPELSVSNQPSYYNTNLLLIENQVYILSIQQLEKVNELRASENKEPVTPTYWMSIPELPKEAFE
jgi:hypothetical protein